MKPVASFRMVNSDSSNSKRVCLFPGHYNTQKVVPTTVSGSAVYVLGYSNPAAIVAAGYACDEVAADYIAAADTKQVIQVTGTSPRCTYVDFLRYIQLSGLRASKIKITNNRSTDHREIFDQEIEVSMSSIGLKAGSQFLNLSTYKDPKNYDLNVIEIDLAAAQLELDETTLAFLTIPASADFTIEFTLSGENA